MKTKMLFPVVFILLHCTSIFAQMPDIGSLMANKTDASQVPETYHFSWKYVMEIDAEGKKINADYLIEKDASYFAARINQLGNDMMMIMDTKAQINIATIGKGAQKIAIVSKATDYSNADKADKNKYTFKSLAEKTILGYKCKGVEATDKAHKITFYYTTEAPVSFAELFKSSLTAEMPDAFASYFKPGDKPLVMAMESVDKASGKTTTMKCLSIDKQEYTFKKSDFKFM